MGFPSLRHPIVLAPLAGGPSTPALAAAVTRAGGLGFLAAGYLSAEALDRRIHETRALTGGALGVNLFCLRPRPVDAAAIAAYAAELEPEARGLGVALGEPVFEDDEWGDKLAVVREAQVEVVSTTFDCPDAEVVGSLQETRASVWVTVCSPKEAARAQAVGADAVVVQGSEAGGHRGSFDDAGDDLPLFELLQLVATEVELPLVAAGGIVDGAGIAAALAAGARAAQLGTAFLLCPEAGTHDAHRRALAAGGATAVTRAFTGRRARGIVNEFMRRHPDAPAAYPQVHHLTAPLRAAARNAGDADSFNLWAGEGLRGVRELPAASLVAQLAAEAAAAS
ncbi:MAG TPA: nitronate monooxygenase [Gaiellaceae bacterium]|nr:nitronate monooxygenase [Gaiellaceae bacterium]